MANFCPNPENWYMVGWTESHICGNMDYFTELHPLENDKKDQRFLNPIAKGTVQLLAKSNGNWGPCTMQEVLYVPGSPNLVSQSKLAKEGYLLEICGHKFTNVENPRKSISYTTEPDKVVAKFRPIRHPELVRVESIYTNFEYKLIWHLRMINLRKEDFLSASFSNFIKFYAGEYEPESEPETNFTQTNPSGGKAGDLVHVYIQKQEIMSGNPITILLLDQATGYVWGCVAKKEKDIGKRIKKFCKKFKSTYKNDVCTLAVTALLGGKLFRALQKDTEKFKKTALYYQHETLVEKEVLEKFSIVMERATRILTLENFPTKLWNHAIDASVYIQNVTPEDSIPAVTPFERLKQTALPINHLRIIGSQAIPYRKKLQKRGKWILIGYTYDGSYTIYNENTEKVVIDAQALICEEQQYYDYLAEESAAALVTTTTSALTNTPATPCPTPYPTQAALPLPPASPAINSAANAILLPTTSNNITLTPTATIAPNPRVPAALPPPSATSTIADTTTFPASTVTRNPATLSLPPASTGMVDTQADPAFQSSVALQPLPAAPAITVTSATPSTAASSPHPALPLPPVSTGIVDSPTIEDTPTTSASTVDPAVRTSLTFLDSKSIFENLLKADHGNRDALSKILEPHEKILKNFETLAKTAKLYANVARLPRSFSFNDIELTAKNEFEALRTTGDGNCMFHALSLVLFSNEEHSKTLRLLLLRHVLSNWYLLLKNCGHCFDKTLEQLIKTIVNQQEWGNGALLFLFSEILEHPIYVVTITSKNRVENHVYISNPKKKRNARIYLFLKKDQKHFEALVPKESVPINSINIDTTLNFFSHIHHKYLCGEKLRVYSSTHKFETAQSTVATTHPNNQTQTNEPEPEVVDLVDTDCDDEETVTLYKCANCKATNKRLQEVYNENARLKKDVQEQLTTSDRQKYFATMQCRSCARLTEKLGVLQAQYNQMRDSTNLHGQRLVETIRKLESQLKEVTRQKNDFQFQNNLFQQVLRTKNQENKKLEQTLVILLQEIERLNKKNKYPSPYVVPPEISLLVNQVLDVFDGTREFSPVHSHTLENDLDLSSDTGERQNPANRTNQQTNNPTADQGETGTDPTTNIMTLYYSNDDEKEAYAEQTTKRVTLQQLCAIFNENNPSSLRDSFVVVANNRPEIMTYECVFCGSKLKSTKDYYCHLCSVHKILLEEYTINGPPCTSNVNEYEDTGPTVAPPTYNLELSESSGAESEHEEFERNIKLSLFRKHLSQKVTKDNVPTDRNSSKPDTCDDVGTQTQDDDSDDHGDDDDDDTRGGIANANYGNDLKESRIIVHRIDLSRYRCKFCLRLFASPEIRDNHEKYCTKAPASSSQQMNDGPKRTSAQSAVPKSKIATKMSTSKSIQDAISTPVTVVPIPSGNPTIVQGFRLRNGANSKSFQVRFPFRVNLAPTQDNAQGSTSAFATTLAEQLIKKMDSKQSTNTDKPKNPNNQTKPLSKRSLDSEVTKNGSAAKKPKTDKRFHCTKCDKSYTENSSLQRHIEDTHRRPGGHECPRCPKILSSRDALVKHDKRKHRGDKEVKCRWCNHKLRSKVAMKTHEMSKHAKKYALAEEAVVGGGEVEGGEEVQAGGEEEEVEGEDEEEAEQAKSRPRRK